MARAAFADDEGDVDGVPEVVGVREGEEAEKLVAKWDATIAGDDALRDNGDGCAKVTVCDGVCGIEGWEADIEELIVAVVLVVVVVVVVRASGSSYESAGDGPSTGVAGKVCPLW